ncbi:MAG TPA: TolC family protein [Chryseolinea sp.]
METNSLKISPKAIAVLLLAVISLSLRAQTLEDYIQHGLKSNLVLQQKNVSLQQAQQSLQIARSYFLPTINVLADYTSGEGGRSIGIPIGDLLNPVYSSLNHLTQSDVFSQVENVNQNFFPKDFYDAKVRTSVPLINSDLYINRTIQSQQVVLKQYEVDAYKRQLVLDIKSAYYNVVAAEAAVKIYESAKLLVSKNVEINESLLRNGKSLPANVLRSKSEMERVNAELNSTRNQVRNARQYLNFLLNKDLDQDVNTASSLERIPFTEDTTGTIGNREEIHMIKVQQEINESSLRMSRLSRLPKMNAFLDIGSQASSWKYNSDSQYYLVGVQFSLPVFQGFRNAIAIRQNKLEIEKTSQHLGNTSRQLELSATLAKNQLQTTVENYRAGQEQLKSAQSYFHLIEKGYKEGVNSLIEYLDARNQFTNSQLQLNLRQLEVLTAQARVERETASYSFEN